MSSKIGPAYSTDGMHTAIIGHGTGTPAWRGAIMSLAIVTRSLSIDISKRKMEIEIEK